MILTKTMINYLLGCETVQEVRGYINGLAVQIAEEPPKVEKFPYIDPIDYKAEQPTKKKLNYRGAQANVLRALWGGTYTLEQIMKEVDLPMGVVTKSLKVLVDNGMVAVMDNQPGGFAAWRLTPVGIPKAKFFMENPNLRVYPVARK